MTRRTNGRTSDNAPDPRRLVDAELAKLAVVNDDQQRLRHRILHQIRGLSHRLESIDAETVQSDRRGHPRARRQTSF